VSDLYRAKWSDTVHGEWITAVLENRPDLTRAQLERTRDLMNMHARDALVTGFEPLIDVYWKLDRGMTSRYCKWMNLTVEIPDDVAQRLAAAGGDLSHRALEALALEEFKLGHLTHPDLRRLLGFNTHYELDGFLKAHGIFEPYTLDDLERERRDLERLGF
jgi:hypothetical protein